MTALHDMYIMYNELWSVTGHKKNISDKIKNSQRIPFLF